MAQTELLDLLTQKMSYLTQRQGVLAENIANVATPKYKPRDLVSFEDVLKQSGQTPGSSGGIQMVVTNPHHLGGMRNAAGPYKVAAEKDVYETKPNGNAVVLEQQMSELSQTSTDYSVVTGLYHKTIGMLKTALGRGGG